MSVCFFIFINIVCFQLFSKSNGVPGQVLRFCRSAGSVPNRAKGREMEESGQLFWGLERQNKG